jgi:hypothetical protein
MHKQIIYLFIEQQNICLLGELKLEFSFGILMAKHKKHNLLKHTKVYWSTQNSCGGGGGSGLTGLGCGGGGSGSLTGLGCGDGGF